MIIENTITLPWLLASWILAYYRLSLIALPVSFIFFLTALRQAHNGFHYTLGTVFAVWTVHHDCDEEVFARTLSTRWKNKLTYNMFYHLEHHLFPSVPTIKLPQLSSRIREGLPDLKTKEVF
jgi:fatty acid desaturase